MTPDEVRSIARREIARAANVILNGMTKAAAKDTASIEELFPGMPTIPERPLVEPYGFHSLAPDGTLNVSARVGEHFGSRYIIGHRDSARPELAAGETVLYNQHGQQIRLENGTIKIGSPSAETENFVLGQVLKELLSELLSLLASHTHISMPPGVLTTPPMEAAQFTTLKTSPVDDEAMLSDTIFGEK